MVAASRYLLTGWHVVESVLRRNPSRVLRLVATEGSLARFEERLAAIGIPFVLDETESANAGNPKGKYTSGKTDKEERAYPRQGKDPNALNVSDDDEDSDDDSDDDDSDDDDDENGNHDPASKQLKGLSAGESNGAVDDIDDDDLDDDDADDLLEDSDNETDDETAKLAQSEEGETGKNKKKTSDPKAQQIRPIALVVRTSNWFDKNSDNGNGPHQGVGAMVTPLLQPSLEDVLKKLGPTSMLIALDQVTDPRNVGAVLRLAALFGADAVIGQTKSFASEGPNLARAASGALEIVPMPLVVNMARTIEELRDHGFWSVALDVALPNHDANGHGDAPSQTSKPEKSNKTSGRQLLGSLPSYAFPARTVLVLGSEHAGLRPLVKESCDVILNIPMPGMEQCRPDIDSLNIASSAAVGMFCYASQRRNGVEAVNPLGDGEIPVYPKLAATQFETERALGLRGPVGSTNEGVHQHTIAVRPRVDISEADSHRHRDDRSLFEEHDRMEHTAGTDDEGANGRRADRKFREGSGRPTQDRDGWREPRREGFGGGGGRSFGRGGFSGRGGPRSEGSRFEGPRSDGPRFEGPRQERGGFMGRPPREGGDDRDTERRPFRDSSRFRDGAPPRGRFNAEGAGRSGPPRWSDPSFSGHRDREPNRENKDEAGGESRPFESRPFRRPPSDRAPGGDRPWNRSGGGERRPWSGGSDNRDRPPRSFGGPRDGDRGWNRGGDDQSGGDRPRFRSPRSDERGSEGSDFKPWSGPRRSQDDAPERSFRPRPRGGDDNWRGGNSRRPEPGFGSRPRPPRTTR